MLVTGKIEVFRNKKGYLTGILKAFNEKKEVVGKVYHEVKISDEKLDKKVVEGKTITIEVTKGYLDIKHVELESESFNTEVISIKEGKVVSVFPEDKKTTKKTTKKSK